MFRVSQKCPSKRASDHPFKYPTPDACNLIFWSINSFLDFIYRYKQGCGFSVHCICMLEYKLFPFLWNQVLTLHMDPVPKYTPRGYLMVIHISIVYSINSDSWIILPWQLAARPYSGFNLHRFIWNRFMVKPQFYSLLFWCPIMQRPIR